MFFRAGGKSVIAKGARPLVMNLEHDIKLSKKYDSHVRLIRRPDKFNL